MTLEQLVPSLEVCQQLKAAGFPQDTAMVWFFRSDALNHYSWVSPRTKTSDDENTVAAPTAGELEEWLFAQYPFVTLAFCHDDKGCYVKIGDRGYQKKKSLDALAALVLEVAG